MIPRKIVERAIRQLPLLLIPIVVTPWLILWLLSTQPTEYTSGATIWVAEAQELGESSIGSENIYATPAQRQSQALGELLGGLNFRIDIAEAAGFYEEVPVDAEPNTPEQRLRDRIAIEAGDAVGVHASGFNTLVIYARHESPAVAQRIAAAVIDQYIARLVSEATRQASTEIDFYTRQLEDAQAEFAERQAAVSEYLSGNPTAANPTVFDPRFNALDAQLAAQQEVVSNLLTGLQRAQLRAATAEQTQHALFSVQDPPMMPIQPDAPSMIMKYGLPFFGVAFGAFVSIAYLYVAYRTDHTVRSTEDLQDLGKPVLGVVPEISVRQGLPWYRRFRREERDYARRVAATIDAHPEEALS